MNYDWNFSRLLPYSHAFITGTITTITLTLIVIVSGSVLGILLGLILKTRFSRFVIYPIIDVIRALPPLVFILFMYFLMTKQVIGTTVQAYWVCAIAMSLNLAAFTAELVRSAIENVPQNSIDAGRALGMSEKHITKHIILPHIMREIIPAMTVLYIGMLKMTSLASVINVREVVYTAQTVIADVSRSLEAWTIVALIYVVLVIPSTYFARWVEKWSGRGSQIRRSHQ